MRTSGQIGRVGRCPDPGRPGELAHKGIGAFCGFASHDLVMVVDGDLGIMPVWQTPVGGHQMMPVKEARAIEALLRLDELFAQRFGDAVTAGTGDQSTCSDSPMEPHRQ